MNKLVVGCSGFIGSHLTEALLKQGHMVIGVDDLSGGKVENMKTFINNKNFTFVQQNIVDYNLPFEVDEVYNLACVKNRVSNDNPVKCIEGNALTAYKTMDKFKDVKRFVHSSTGSVYGAKNFITEQTSCSPVSIYGINKLAGESYLKFFPFPSVCLRYFHVYGLRGQGVVNKFIERHKQGYFVEVWGDGEQKRCFTHVSDIVRANLEAEPGIHNVCSGIRVSVNEVVKMIEKVSGKKVQVVFKDAMLNDIRDFHVNSNFRIEYKVNLIDEIAKIYELI